MAIKRGGPGGPGGPRHLPRTEAEPRAERPSAREPARAEPPRAPAGFDADAFDDELMVQRSSPGERAEDLFRAESRSSGVRSTERLLETTYERLAHDYRAVHAEARGLVRELAREGFSPDAIESASDALQGYRARMSKVRGRLATIRRRLRTLSLPSGSVQDLQLQQRLGARIRTVSELEKGADRALMALQLATAFRPRGAGGEAAAFVRVDVEGARDRAALGSELARHAPEATSTGTLLRLLSGDAPAEKAPATGEGSSDVKALRSFAASQLGT